MQGSDADRGRVNGAARPHSPSGREPLRAPGHAACILHRWAAVGSLGPHWSITPERGRLLPRDRGARAMGIRTDAAAQRRPAMPFHIAALPLLALAPAPEP